MSNLTKSLDHDFQESANKKILTTSAGFGILREGLIKNLGTNRAKGFLLRYGWSLGASDAEEAMKVNDSLDFLIKQASILHLSTGHIGDVQAERSIEMSDAHTVKSIRASGKWIDSFEANEHLKLHGISDQPVCHTLTGYASGYMSTIFKHKVIVKETSCIGLGNSECRFEVRLEEEWGNEIQDELKFYHEKNIITELEYTYEQLLEQRNYIEKVSKFHKELTEGLSNGSNLQEIANTTYALLGIPFSIEDLSFQKIVYAGINEEKYVELSKELKGRLIKKNHLLPLFKETTRIRTPDQERLITPIMVQKKIIGYCTFLYFDQGIKCTENDFMFIERAANAASLFLLNEKTSFEAIEKMKGYFLEQILMGQYTSKDEIIKRGRHMGFDLDIPFYMAAITYVDRNNTQKSQNRYDQILESIVKYLDIQGYRALIGQYEGHMIMLIPETANLLPNMEKFIKHLELAFPAYQYKIGISDKSTEIDNVLEYLEESMIALRMSSEKKIIHFKDLGIVGVLINSKNIKGIKRIAVQELGPIFNLDEGKQGELMKTLYVFLSNGGKLQQSMDDLSLSMSGLMYRINKIEKLIDKDLRDPTQSYQLLLILESLLALGELDLSIINGQ